MRRSAICFALVAVFAPATLGAAPADLAWDTAFRGQGPKAVHFTARAQDVRGASHNLEVWRDGADRLRRDTDGALSIVAEKQGDSHRFLVIDRGRRLRVHARRETLLRLGVFSADFPTLAGRPRRPDAPHTVRALGKTASTPAGSCAFYRIEMVAGGGEDICWSSTWGLPLEVRRLDGTTTFRVTSAEARLPSTAFRMDTDLADVDADRDIAPTDD